MRLLKLHNRPIRYPYVGFFSNMISSYTNFKWIKANHGFYDIFIDYEINKVEAYFKHDHEKLADLILSHHRIGAWHNKADKDTLKSIIINSFTLFTSVTNESNKILFGVSETNGMPVWTRKESKELVKKRMSLIDIFTNKRSDLFYHGGLFRHYDVMDESQKLINAINDNNRKVFMIGPKYLESLSDIFTKFEHLVIPNKNAMLNIDSITSSMNSNISKNDIVIVSAGFYIASHLLLNIKKDVTFIDIGRGFDYTIKYKLNTKNPWKDLMFYTHPNKLKKSIKNYRAA